MSRLGCPSKWIRLGAGVRHRWYSDRSSCFPILNDDVVVGSEEFKRNKELMDSLVHELEVNTNEAREGLCTTNLSCSLFLCTLFVTQTCLHEYSLHLGGGAVARARHEKRKKLFVRDRIEFLVDPGSAFLELSALAGRELYGKDKVPAGGELTLPLPMVVV